jgi:DNA-binding response OmpR family regulator
MTGEQMQTRESKWNVLIVDDERGVAEAIAGILDRHGMQTVLAHDGDQALALARESEPDLVLLDVTMPGRSGIEVCATLKTNPDTASIPVILVTAKAEKNDHMVGMAAGADEYLSKPFNPAELMTLVDEMLAGKSSESDLQQPASYLQPPEPGEQQTWETTRRHAQEPRTERMVLIADDEEAVAKAIAVTLDRQGLETVVAHDGDQVLTLARTMRPDLILMDVMMPGRSGIEVCATLKTNPEMASIPVILITAKGEQTDRMVGIAAGADEYLAKPFSPTELMNLVDQVLAGRPIEPRLQQPDLSDLPSDQLVVFAQEWRELLERERMERQALEEAHQRLEEAHHHLEEVDRLKAAFLGVVTHELMTPFGAIGMAMQVLQRLTENFPPNYQAAMDDLLTEIAELHRLVGGVVKFAELVSKQRDPQPGNISLTQLIPWAVQPAAVMAQAREIDFRVFAPPDSIKVHADPELLGEAVFQMAHNAVKFNKPGGQAHIRVVECPGGVVIEVADTGIGLTRERMKMLGQPFEQDADALRRGREGLGVGWAFVRYVAEVHGGWTHVESTGPGQGSTFSLLLPLSAPPSAENGIE